MIDHRRLQRTLFRMQLDPAFAAAILAGAVSEPGLGLPELALLRRAPPEGIQADHRGRRRAQVLGNIASEYVLTLVEAARGPLGAAFVNEFSSSEEFHRALSEESRLPTAFGAWARKRAVAAREGVAAAIAALETAMALARRDPRPAAAPGRGEIALSDRAWLVTLPDGTFLHAQALREALDAGDAPPPQPRNSLVPGVSEGLDAAVGDRPPASSTIETILLVVEEGPGSHRLRDVKPERLEPDVAALLCEALEPLSAATLARLAAERDWVAVDVEEFVNDLVAEGVLRRG